jgi:hypothetical protein
MESFIPSAAARSVSGSTIGSGLSRPSLTVAQEGLEGSIAGTIMDAAGSPVTNAVVVALGSDGTPDATSFTDENGNFLLHTLAAGSYQLTVYNQYVSATGWVVDAQNYTQGNGQTVQGPNVGVAPGQTSNAGTIAD